MNELTRPRIPKRAKWSMCNFLQGESEEERERERERGIRRKKKKADEEKREKHVLHPLPLSCLALHELPSDGYDCHVLLSWSSIILSHETKEEGERKGKRENTHKERRTN